MSKFSKIVASACLFGFAPVAGYMMENNFSEDSYYSSHESNGNEEEQQKTRQEVYDKVEKVMKKAVYLRWYVVAEDFLIRRKKDGLFYRKSSSDEDSQEIQFSVNSRDLDITWDWTLEKNMKKQHKALAKRLYRKSLEDSESPKTVLMGSAFGKLMEHNPSLTAPLQKVHARKLFKAKKGELMQKKVKALEEAIASNEACRHDKDVQDELTRLVLIVQISKTLKSSRKIARDEDGWYVLPKSGRFSHVDLCLAPVNIGNLQVAVSDAKESKDWSYPIVDTELLKALQLHLEKNV